MNKKAPGSTHVVDVNVNVGHTTHKWSLRLNQMNVTSCLNNNSSGTTVQ